MEFSRPEYWSGLPFPSLGDLPDPGIEPMSLCLLYRLAGSLLPAPPGTRTLTLKPPVPGVLVFPCGQR